MAVTLKGFNEQVATFLAENVKKGDLVKITEENTVSACENGNEFCGICVNGAGSTVSVVLAGYVEIAFSGTGLDYGYQTVVADGTGGVKKASTGKKVLVTKLDAVNSTIGFIM